MNIDFNFINYHFFFKILNTIIFFLIIKKYGSPIFKSAINSFFENYLKIKRKKIIELNKYICLYNENRQSLNFRLEDYEKISSNISKWEEALKFKIEQLIIKNNKIKEDFLNKNELLNKNINNKIFIENNVDLILERVRNKIIEKYKNNNKEVLNYIIKKNMEKK